MSGRPPTDNMESICSAPIAPEKNLTTGKMTFTRSPSSVTPFISSKIRSMDILGTNGDIECGLPNKLKSLKSETIVTPQMRLNALFTPPLTHHLPQYRSASVMTIMKATPDSFSRYDIYLNFTGEFKTDQNMSDYRAFKQKDYNAPLGIFCFILASTFCITGGSSIRSLSEPAILAAAFSAFIAFLFMLLTVITRLAALADDDSFAWLQRFKRRTILTTNRFWYDSNLEDGVIVFTAIAASLTTLGCALKTACSSPESNVNTSKISHMSVACLGREIPESSYTFTMIAVLLMQLFWKGSSRHAILASWVICLFVTNASLAILSSTRYFFVNSQFFFIIAVSYEIERSTVCQFVKAYIVSEAKKISKSIEREADGARREFDISNRVNHELQGTVANSAHDVKSPCTAISLAIETIEANMLAQQDVLPSDVTAENLSLIKTVMQTLVYISMASNRVSDFAKLTCNIKLVPCIGLLKLPACIAEVVECVNWQEFEKGSTRGVAIKVGEIPPDVPTEGMTDVSWFKENLLCIASNAVKHSQHLADTTIHVQLIWRQDSDHLISPRVNKKYPVVQISIEDNGQTLSNIQLSQLFSRPTQSERSHVGGMGLGLICLAERVSTLGGTFGAHKRNDSKEGNVVWFRIPFPSVDKKRPMLARGTSAASMTGETLLGYDKGRLRAKSVSKLSNLSILIVDDAVPILKIMNFVLTKAKATVAQAKNGREAVDLARERPFDIIITDIQMPIMDGFKAVKLIRECELSAGGHRSIIIGISASSQYMNSADAIEAGMDGFLAKPFQLKDLAEHYVRVKDERASRRGSERKCQERDTMDHIVDKVVDKEGG